MNNVKEPSKISLLAVISLINEVFNVSFNEPVNDAWDKNCQNVVLQSPEDSPEQWPEKASEYDCKPNSC